MVKILTDTSSLFTPAEGMEKGFSVAPLTVTIAGKTYREREEIETTEFINIINEGHLPTSSQPTPADLMEYYEKACFIIDKFVPEIGKETLLNCTKNAYAKFDGEPATAVKLDEGLFVMELWHGPTHAFKDVALTLLPYLMVNSKKILGRDEKTLQGSRCITQ